MYSDIALILCLHNGPYGIYLKMEGQMELQALPPHFLSLVDESSAHLSLSTKITAAPCADADLGGKMIFQYSLFGAQKLGGASDVSMEDRQLPKRRLD